MSTDRGVAAEVPVLELYKYLSVPAPEPREALLAASNRSSRKPLLRGGAWLSGYKVAAAPELRGETHPWGPKQGGTQSRPEHKPRSLASTYARVLRDEPTLTTHR